MLDVIVIGGGFAGVTAARELAVAGRRVALLEARDRLGGRTWTSTWGEHTVELGGGWVHWFQPHVFAELTRAGLELAESHWAGHPEYAWLLADGTLRTGDTQRRRALAAQSFGTLDRLSAQVLPRPHDPLFRRDELEAVDRLSIGEWLSSLEVDEEARAIASGELCGVAHGFLEETGLTAALRWWALAGFSSSLAADAAGRYTIRQGTRPLIEAIAGQASFEQQLGVHVARIEQDGESARAIASDGTVYEARRIVCAVPLNTLGAIEFRPGLADDKQAAIACGQPSRGSKIWIEVRGTRTPRLVTAPGGHPLNYLMSERELPHGQLLVAFCEDAERMPPDDLEATRAAVEQLWPGLDIVGVHGHDWLADPLSQGTWAAHRPGWYLDHHRALQQPEGRIVFASGDIAEGWAGFIDGAIESGLRAARAVLVQGSRQNASSGRA